MPPAQNTINFAADAYDEKDVVPASPIRPRRRSRTLSQISSISSTSSKICIRQGSPLALPTTEPFSDTRKPHPTYGSFTLTRSATSFLHSLVPQRSRPQLPIFERKKHAKPPVSTLRTDLPDAEDSSTPSSPMSVNTPSITRTSSASSSEQFTLPPALLQRPPHHRRGSSEINPILARLEKQSRFCTSKMVCSTCAKPGRDYPRCPRCAEVWCSRECRLRGGTKHTCSRSRTTS